jgi:hypothetical protein
VKRKFKDRRKESGISRRKESRRTGELLQGNDYPTCYIGRSVSLLSFLLALLSPALLSPVLLTFGSPHFRFSLLLALLSRISRKNFISEVAGLALFR